MRQREKEVREREQDGRLDKNENEHDKRELLQRERISRDFSRDHRERQDGLRVQGKPRIRGLVPMAASNVTVSPALLQQTPYIANMTPDVPRTVEFVQGTRANDVAAIIAAAARSGGKCPELLCNGTQRVIEAVKAVALARDVLESEKLDLRCYPKAKGEEDGVVYDFTFSLAKGRRSYASGTPFQKKVHEVKEKEQKKRRQNSS